jgi:hypothetical protein
LRTGRPPIAPEHRRSEQVTVRLSPAEYDRLYAVARLMRMDVRALIRELAVPPDNFRRLEIGQSRTLPYRRGSAKPHPCA